MRRFRKLKLAVAVLMPVLILFSCSGAGYAAASGRQQKHETVYAYLDHDGSILKQSVVNRINYAGGSPVEDYGEYSSIKALNFNLIPSISGSRVVWDIPTYSPGVLFYEGVTERELPVKIDIDYLLNGHPVPGEELAGQEGKVTIKIGLENRLQEKREIEYIDSRGKPARKLEEIHVPLMVQISIPVDLERFSYVESADDPIKVVSGDTMTVSFGAFPFPEQVITLELVGKNIALEPITFAVIPMMPPIPEVEMEEELDGLYTGVQSLNQAVSELESMKGSLGQVSRLVDGVDELSRGGQMLVENSDDLLDGLFDFVLGTAEISSATGTISSGMSDLAAGCAELEEGAAELAEGAWGIHHGVQGVAGGVGQLTAALEMVEDLADLLEQLAEHELIGPILEGYQLDALLARMEELAKAVKRLQGGLDALAIGSRELARGADGLSFGISQVADGSSRLSDGTKELYAGTGELAAGGRGLYKGTAEYLHGVDKLSWGLDQVNDGMAEMDREMGRLKNLGLMDTGGKSLDDIEYSLQQSLEELRLGQSTAAEMEILAAQYVSFMDERNEDSSIQFILKTKAIDYKLPAAPAEETEQPKKGFWQKLKELFGFGGGAGGN